MYFNLLKYINLLDVWAKVNQLENMSPEEN